jgi:hypothetical protein
LPTTLFLFGLNDIVGFVLLALGLKIAQMVWSENLLTCLFGQEKERELVFVEKGNWIRVLKFSRYEHLLTYYLVASLKFEDFGIKKLESSNSLKAKLHD